MSMKYIICQDFSGQPIPFIFPEKVAHEDMRAQLPYGTVLSAGYIALNNGEFVCHGGDVALNTVAQPEDAELLMHFFKKSYAGHTKGDGSE